MEFVVARIGRAHGLRGEVTLQLRTDEPETRFAPGQVLHTDPNRGDLTVASARNNQGNWTVRFQEVTDRTGAEALTNTLLTIDGQDSEEDDAWYPHELVGLRAHLRNGNDVGEIVGVEHGAAQDNLVLLEPGGHRTLIPFVHAIVPEVDRDQGIVFLTPPGGLLAADANNLVISSDETAAKENKAMSHYTEHELAIAEDIVDKVAVAPPSPPLTEDELAAAREEERAIQRSAQPAPRVEHRYPGEIIGTLPAEDKDSHVHNGTND